MATWLRAKDVKSWMVQGVSLRGTVVILIFLATLISELRFSWVEILTGRYLAVTNGHRPELGAVWDQGRLKQVATQTLEQMTTQQFAVRREAREATSLAELVDGLGTGQGAMISTDQFKALYVKIPESVARTLFSPILMLRITAEKSWARVYLEKENGQVGIYLLDRDNNVLGYSNASDQQLRSTGIQRPTLSGTLEEQDAFAGRIYPADRFFMALDTLSRESQQGVLLHPDALLTAEGTPLRVGIGDEVNADLIRIGVEMDTPQGKTIYLLMGKAWAVWEVRTLLEPGLPKRSHTLFHRLRRDREP